LKTFEQFITEAKTGISKKSALRMFYDAGFDSEANMIAANESLSALKQPTEGYYMASDVSAAVKTFKPLKEAVDADAIRKVMSLFRAVGIKTATEENAKKFIGQKGTLGALLKEL